jgi:hypothetical protein
MCACKTEQQLLDDVLVENISTNYKGDGEMARQGIRWFPTLMTQAVHFMKTGFLVENEQFARTCKFYWGDMTFAEVGVIFCTIRYFNLMPSCVLFVLLSGNRMMAIFLRFCSYLLLKSEY